MILDAFAQFTGSTTAVVANNTGNSDGTDSPTQTTTSTFIVDLHMAGIPVLTNTKGARDMGIGDDPSLKILAIVTVTFANATDMTTALQGATDNGSGSPNAFVTLVTGPVVTEANLVAGASVMPYDFPRPPQGVAIPRFLQLAYTITGTHNAGKIRGNIVLDRIDQYITGTNNAVLSGYPPGITIAN